MTCQAPGRRGDTAAAWPKSLWPSLVLSVHSMQVLIVLGTCFVVLRTRLLASYHVMPLNKLLLVRMLQHAGPTLRCV